MWTEILPYIAIGFAAQMVDGAIGMAYGITSTTALLSIGVPPAVASACIHAAETFTTAASGLSHWKLGNFDRRLIIRLAIPGMIGGILGAYILSQVNGDVIRPFISAYLLALGIFILCKAYNGCVSRDANLNHVAPLGLFGGFVDAIGGGGWGPIVASTLLGRGAAPRTTIGSVNIAEFFVTLVISGTLIFTVGLSLWKIIAGLVIGGIIAAPFAALATRQIPARGLLTLVGCVICLVSARSLWLTLMA